MAKQLINVGTNPNDGTGDSLRVAGQKINNNLNELYSFFGDGSNLSSSVDYAATAGSANTSYYSSFSGVAQSLETYADVTVGIITASAYAFTGTPSVYSGSAGITTLNSNLQDHHYITFDTSTSEINISNFQSGKKFVLNARNTAAGVRNLNIKTSESESGFVNVPVINSTQFNTTTGGTISVSAYRGYQIDIYNLDGSVFGHAY